MFIMDNKKRCREIPRLTELNLLFLLLNEGWAKDNKKNKAKFVKNNCIFELELVEEDTDYGIHEFYELSVFKDEKYWITEVRKDWDMDVQLKLIQAFIEAHTSE